MKIIYVDVDTLRPGPHRALRLPPRHHAEPGRDGRARASSSTATTVSDSPCLPSRTALTSGQFGITNGVVGHFGDDARFRLDAGHAPRPGRPLLGQALASAGYLCASVSSFAERHRAYFFLGNFRETMQVTPQIGDEPADPINDAAIDWIEQHRDVEDWYLHLTYWDPHTDYLQDPCVDRAGGCGRTAPRRGPTRQAIDRHVAEIYGPRSAVDLHYANGARPVARSAQHARRDPHPRRLRAPHQRLRRRHPLLGPRVRPAAPRPRRDLGLTDEVAIVVCPTTASHSASSACTPSTGWPPSRSTTCP